MSKMHRTIQSALLLLVGLIGAAILLRAVILPRAGESQAKAAAVQVADALARIASRADPPTCSASGEILVNVETAGDARITLAPGSPPTVVVTVTRSFGPWGASWRWSIEVPLPPGATAVQSSAGEGKVTVWLRGCQVGISGGGG